MSIRMLLAISFGLLNFPAAFASDPSLLKVEIDCRFDDDSRRQVDARGYALERGGPLDHADIEIKANGIMERVLQLDFRPSDELTLFLIFATPDHATRLEIFTDDMGGMSALTADGIEHRLTCSVFNY
jgi:hypothetical protein